MSRLAQYSARYKRALQDRDHALRVLERPMDWEQRDRRAEYAQAIARDCEALKERMRTARLHLIRSLGSGVLSS